MFSALHRLLPILLFLLVPSARAALPALQPLVDAAPAGSVLRPPPGRYAGPVTIARPLVLDGGGVVTIDGGGRGTVVSVTASGTVVRGVHIRNSGGSHDAVDAGLLVTADDVVVEGNRLDDVLFGVHLRQVSRATVRGNRLRGRPAELNLRGDGVRLWNSRQCRVEGNVMEGMRDITLANAPDNRIAGNTVRDGRYGVHLVFSPRTVVEGNTVERTTSGIVVLFSDNVRVRGNAVRHVRDAAGSGLAFKDSSELVVEGNEVLNCSVGAQANTPLNPWNAIRFAGNRFAHNVTGLYFYGDRGGHVLTGNRFEGNLTTVAVTSPAGARGNDWRANVWDDYQGFDRNHDGVGDTPHELWSFADRIWMEFPMARFFRNAPVLELLDLLERLAPFSAPELLLRDSAPVMLKRTPAR